MVAFTTTYELPYMEGSDPPCFGPGTSCDTLESVFCDFVSLVEAQLDENDLIIGRTATAIPMAGISLTFASGAEDPFSLPPAGGSVPFDTVDFDTDNMTSFASDGILVITPQRNGVYLVIVKLEFQAPSGGSVMFSSLEDIVAPALAASGYSPTLHANEVSGSQYFQYTDSSPLPRALRVSFGTGFSNVTTLLYEAKLSAFWVSDL